jgi:glycosyltransferase involved in cell wall biosynthesis
MAEGVADSAATPRTIGVVIRTLNESELIGTCFERLRRQRGPFDLDIIVVDSGSTDGTVDIARSHGGRIVELPPQAFDYSKALNLGIEKTQGDIVLSLSAHAIPVDEDWLGRMVAPFAAEDVAAVSSRQIPWPDAPWQELHRLGQQFGEDRIVYSRASPGEVMFSNAASAFRRSVWRDEPFTLPAVEDLEWAARVVAAGWTIVYEPEAAVYHSHHENPRAQARRMIDINRVQDTDETPRTRRRTLREAAGLFVRDTKKILALNEPFRRKLGHIVDLFQVVCYYVIDFRRSGTTAERRRADAH